MNSLQYLLAMCKYFHFFSAIQLPYRESSATYSGVNYTHIITVTTNM